MVTRATKSSGPGAAPKAARRTLAGKVRAGAVAAGQGAVQAATEVAGLASDIGELTLAASPLVGIQASDVATDRKSVG